MCTVDVPRGDASKLFQSLEFKTIPGKQPPNSCTEDALENMTLRQLQKVENKTYSAAKSIVNRGMKVLKLVLTVVW